jgi:hypothetical protein
VRTTDWRGLRGNTIIVLKCALPKKTCASKFTFDVRAKIAQTGINASLLILRSFRGFEKPTTWYKCRAPVHLLRNFWLPQILSLIIYRLRLVRGDSYFFEPPSWSGNGKRPASGASTSFYWEDPSWTKSCQWDIGRLLNENLPLRVHSINPAQCRCAIADVFLKLVSRH